MRDIRLSILLAFVLLVSLTVNKFCFNYYQRGLFELVPLILLAILTILIIGKLGLFKEFPRKQKSILIALISVTVFASSLIVINKRVLNTCKFCIATLSSSDNVHDNAGHSRILFKKINHAFVANNPDQYKNKNGFASLNSSVLNSYGRLTDNITNSKQVKRLFRGNSDIKAIVWGNSSWLQLSLKSEKPVSSKQINSPFIVGHIGNLPIITNISHVRLNIPNLQDTSEYLSHIFQGLAQKSSSDIGVLDFKRAGAVSSRWQTSQHLAYAKWLYANSLLVSAVKAGRFQEALFLCAMMEYKQASKLSIMDETPELTLAIAHNRAVTEMMYGILTKDKAYIKSANFWLSKVQEGKKKFAKSQRVSRVIRKTIVKSRAVFKQIEFGLKRRKG